MTPQGAPVSTLHAPILSRPFAIMLGVSLGVHLAVFIGYAWWDSRKMDIIEIETPIKASLVRLGKPRDPKLLPRIDQAPAPKPAAKQTPVPINDAKAVQKLNDKEEKEDKERMQSAVERIREMQEREQQKDDAMARIAERVGKADAKEEPEGQEDGHKQGDSPTPAQANAYFASLKMAVRQHYVVPTLIQMHECAKLEATVGVRLNADGEVQSVTVMKSSGSDIFDPAVVQAVKKASPLPAPPPNMREVVTRGFGFKFRCSE